MPIKLAEHLDLPDDAATQVYAFMGRRGSGKTYAAGRLVEQLRAHGDQVVILDPVGVWYGLRLASDGKAPGLKIHVFGGNHGDLPLEAGGGKVIAELVAERGISLVLDVSGFKKAEQRRFVADFAEELFHAKKRHRSALMVIFEEVQEFCPQHVTGDAARMVGAIESMIKLGRNYGVGAALLSQRPQAVNKDILNLSECLLAFQLTGPQERKTIEGWVREKGADGRGEIGDELPSLPIGTAMIWSPQWLQHFGRHKVLAKKTFDASATPAYGKPQRQTVLAPIDLEAVREAMAATIEQAKQNDPAALRAEVSRLSSQIRRLTSDLEAARAAPAIAKPIEVPTVPSGLPESIKELHRRANAVMTHAEAVLAGLTVAGAREGDMHPPPAPRSVSPPPRGALNGHARPPRPAPVSVADGDIGKCPRAILAALVQLGGEADDARLAATSRYSVTSSSYEKGLSALRTRGFLAAESTPDRRILTEAGRGAAGDVPPLPTGEDLLDHWVRELGKCPATMLRAIFQRGTITRQQLAEDSGYSITSSSYEKGLSKLRVLGLATGPDGGDLTIAEAFR
jgi:hypothetical protein